MPDFGEVRALLADGDGLVRAIGSETSRSAQPADPAVSRWRRVEVRPVNLSGQRCFQVNRFDEQKSFTTNFATGAEVADAVLELGLTQWRVETTSETLQVRLNRKGRVVVTRGPASSTEPPDLEHDRTKVRLLSPQLSLFRALDLADKQGRIKPSRQAKYRQIEEFVKALEATLESATSTAKLRLPGLDRPWQMVDLGCGNAYLTFAAQAWVASREWPAHFVGVDVKEQSRRHNTEIAAQLGVADAMSFTVGAIAEVELQESPDIVLALHACDTATDEALARAVGWGSAVILAAPCCHHDLAAQLRKVGAPAPYGALVRDGIVRERLADTLTDALRALLLRSVGYRVSVVEFIDSQHTSRNSLIRAVRTGRNSPTDRAEYEALAEQWQIVPRLAELLSAQSRSTT